MITLPPSLDRALARKSLIHFVRKTWQKNNEPFIVGHHTREVACALDEACDRLAKGQSTYLAIKIPFRHGKSDIASRYLPCYFLGRFPEKEIVHTTYGASLSYTFSRDARRILQSQKFSAIFPGVTLPRGDASVESWGVVGGTGHVYWAGLGGALTGKGASLAIVDDFFKGREEAESERIRDKRWDDFTNSVMTRLAPAHIVVVIGTPWHVDDLFGRIKKNMAEDPDFPYFKELKFPAESVEYGTGVLFPERYTKKWYRVQRSVLGAYAASGLLDCDPQVRHGKILRGDLIVVKHVSKFPSGILWVRGYDLASSTKERAKDDPDFTVGVKLGVQFLPTEVPGLLAPVIYIADIVRGQWEATERNKKIIATAVKDGSIPIAIEAFGAYKDAYTVLKGILAGTRGVVRVNLPGDKIAKASALEPILEAGHFIIREGCPHLDDLKKEFLGFPSAGHDDIVDAVRVAYELARKTLIGERRAI